MKNIDEYVMNLYRNNEYINNNPSLHEEDSPWKVSKIIYFIDKVISCIDRDEINLLDVGGGAGLILNAISSHIERNYKIKVNKIALDLSPGMLEIQRNNNPDLKKALNENICETSISDKEIDITLMIDVLEHVSTPAKALEQVKRISNFVILKVPIEDSFFHRTWNFLRMGKYRQRLINIYGHINVYNFRKLKSQIEKYAGRCLDFRYTNSYDYFWRSRRYKSVLKNLICIIAVYIYRLSPRLCSIILGDFVIILVKCY